MEEDKRQEKIDEILNYTSPIKVRGFEEVTMIKIDGETTLPTRGSKESAGYDFYSKEYVDIQPGSKYVFWSDVKSYMMGGEVLQIHVRSSIGIKKGLVLANGTGIIDTDYYSNPSNDGNIGICLINESDRTQYIESGERIAQGIFIKFLVADNVTSTKERTGGIGSTNQ